MNKKKDFIPLTSLFNHVVYSKECGIFLVRGGEDIAHPVWHLFLISELLFRTLSIAKKRVFASGWSLFLNMYRSELATFFL